MDVRRDVLAAALAPGAAADRWIRPTVARARLLREMAFVVRVTARLRSAHAQRLRELARAERARLAELRSRCAP